MMYKKVAVVVEGGGMRGAYTGGILDVFNELGLRFGGACGTSAGVTHLCSFLSEQIGRNFRQFLVGTDWPKFPYRYGAFQVQ